MNKASPEFKPTRCVGSLLAVCAATLLCACAGGGDSESGNAHVATASGVTTLQLATATLPDTAAAQLAQPAFHVAPAQLNPPDDADAADNDTSARRGPRTQAVPAEFKGLSPRRLSMHALEAAGQMRATSVQDADDGSAAPMADGAASPMIAGSVISTYTPAQIRAAYGLPALPTAGTTLSAAQAAQLGAGQTIYIVDAMHDPNIATELAAFNQKFGLPACTTISINASLPLAAASSGGCEFSVVYSTAGGAMAGVAPAYDAAWATEIALDVQWAHATAPLARIILIEAPVATVNGLLGGVKLANSMGPGIVSMSFGVPEGNWTSSVDSVFSVANMTYLAGTGDSGAGVWWPAVSPNVVAVGGTTLTYSGTGARSEVSWSGTGGGVSGYTPAPEYQNNAVPGMGTMVNRTVADVAFNADPATGQYVAVVSPGSSTVKWLSAGGTSLSTPQWAGLIAVANAQRALAAKPALGAPHAVLYGQIAAVPGIYASAFANITRGSDGGCNTCSAKAGYDHLTGLGTPNVASLLSALTGAAAAATAPAVTSASISGKIGTALSFTVSVIASNPVTYSLRGAPPGMTISTAGAVTWATPVAGIYSVTAIAMDTRTGLSGQGVYSVAIAAQQAPVGAATTINGTPGTALSFTIAFTAANPVTYTLSGAPAAMSVNSAGVVSWASPVAGAYTVIATARDTKTGLSGQGVYTVIIAAAGPVITASAMTGVVGKPLTGTISISDPGATAVSGSISGAPLGMAFSVNGLTVTATWVSPGLGSYSLTVSVVDSAGRTARASVPITIAAK